MITLFHQCKSRLQIDMVNAGECH